AKGDGTFYKDKNQIERFFYNDANAKEPIPELGVIGDGTQGKKRNEDRPAATDNKPSAAAAPRQQAAAAGGAGRKPWGSK
uniref:hypothetical protein n=1 Tax=Staphylococcus aureus TaxID=1280 RepID=UPI0038B371AB